MKTLESTLVERLYETFSAIRVVKSFAREPFERERFLALELEAGALDGAKGVLKAAGRKTPLADTSLAA